MLAISVMEAAGMPRGLAAQRERQENQWQHGPYVVNFGNKEYHVASVRLLPNHY